MARRAPQLPDLLLNETDRSRFISGSAARMYPGESVPGELGWAGWTLPARQPITPCGRWAALSYVVISLGTNPPADPEVDRRVTLIGRSDGFTEHAEVSHFRLDLESACVRPGSTLANPR